MSLVTVSVISGLKGTVGSHPEIYRFHPPGVQFDEKTLLAKTLPIGAIPDQFFADKFDKKPILVYIFKIENANDRDDLASLGIVLDKDARIEEMKKLISAIISDFHINNVLTLEFLENNLGNLVDAVNSQSKLKYIGDNNQKYQFDISKFLKSNQLQLKELDRKQKGGFL